MMFCSGWEHFANLRHIKRCETCVSGLNARFRGTEVAKKVSQRKHLFYFFRPKMMFCSGWEHFANLRHVKRCETCFAGQNALFQGTEVAKNVSQDKHPFYSIRPKMMFGSNPEHFANLRYVKRCKTCVSGLNTLFQGTEVVRARCGSRTGGWSLPGVMSD